MAGSSALGLGNQLTEWKNPAVRNNLTRVGFGLALAAIGGLGLMVYAQNTDGSFRELGIIPILLIFVGIVGALILMVSLLALPVALLNSRHRVTTYEHGFVDAVGGSETVVLYKDIIKVERRVPTAGFGFLMLGVIGSLMEGMLRKSGIKYTFHTANKKVRISGSIVDEPDRFGEQVQEGMVPHALAALANGAALNFGGGGMFSGALELRRDGIYRGSNVIPWQDVTEVRTQVDGKVEVFTKAKRGATLSLAYAALNSAWLFHSVAKKLAGSQGAMQGGEAISQEPVAAGSAVE